jgi:hypothetical protein
MPLITRGTDGKVRANENPVGESFGKKVGAEEEKWSRIPEAPYLILGGPLYSQKRALKRWTKEISVPRTQNWKKNSN